MRSDEDKGYFVNEQNLHGIYLAKRSAAFASVYLQNNWNISNTEKMLATSGMDLLGNSLSYFGEQLARGNFNELRSPPSEQKIQLALGLVLYGLSYVAEKHFSYKAPFKIKVTQLR